MKEEKFSSDDRIFSFNDLRRLYRKNRKKIRKVAFLSGTIVICFLLLTSTRYTVESWFKEVREGEKNEEGLSAIFGGLSPAKVQTQASYIMQSSVLLKPVVAKMGLQVHVQTKNLFSKVFGRVLDKIKSQMRLNLKDPDSFVFKDVTYISEQGKSLFLRFTSTNNFEVLSVNKKKVVQGRIGEVVTFEDFEFTLEKTPKSLKIKKNYHMEVLPWKDTVNSIQAFLRIKPEKANKTILKLEFKHRDRHQASHILNRIMEEYQIYLKAENDRLSKAQLAYLEKRQSELSQKFEKNIDEHVAYLKKNLGVRGFIGLDQEIYNFMTPYQEYGSKLYAIDLEMLRLKGDGRSLYAQDSLLGKELSRIGNTLEGLKQHRDQLDMALNFRSVFPELNKGRFSTVAMAQNLRDRLEKVDYELKKEGGSIDGLAERKEKLLLKQAHLEQALGKKFEQIENRSQELKNIRTTRNELENLLNQKKFSVGALSNEIGNVVAIWAEKLHRLQKDGPSSQEFLTQKEDFEKYLQNLVRLLSVRENILQERMFQKNHIPKEFEGIDLETAKKLYVDYNHKLDQFRHSMRHLLYLSRQIKNPDFEISSLSPSLIDPASQEFIRKASDLALRIRDEKNRSSKEAKRLLNELSLQRDSLLSHIKEMIEIKKLNTQLTEEKIQALQEVTLDQINQQISILNEQSRDYLRSHREYLGQEKELLNSKMDEIRKQMVSLPEKWRLENKLKLKTEMGLKMVQSLTDLVEKKTIGHHLLQIESKPLDYAFPPRKPDSPHLFAFFFVAAFLGAGIMFLVIFIRTLIRGFPTSEEILGMLKQKVLGSISYFCDGPSVDPIRDLDLETLRKMILFVDPLPSNPESFGKCVSLISGRGSDYSYSLAKLISKRECTVLLVQCSFDSIITKEKTPGFLQYLEGEIKKLPIRKGKEFDYLPAGGNTRFGVEILNSPKFKNFIEELKKQYDLVLLVNSVDLSLTETKVFLSFSDKVIVTVHEEPIDLLQPFIRWAYYDGKCRLSFVTSYD